AALACHHSRIPASPVSVRRLPDRAVPHACPGLLCPRRGRGSGRRGSDRGNGRDREGRAGRNGQAFGSLGLRFSAISIKRCGSLTTTFWRPPLTMPSPSQAESSRLTVCSVVPVI